jgi:CRISPR-associated protein Cas2
MRVIVSYDVATTSPGGAKRLRKVAKACKSFGARVQYSVFECSLEEKDFVRLRDKVLSVMDPELDSVRIYFLSEDDARKTEHHGVREPVDLDGPLVV